MSLRITCDSGLWKDTARHAAAVLRLAGKDIVASNVTALIESAPHDDAESRDQEFRHRSYCRKCLDLACDWMAYKGTSEDEAAYSEAERHFMITVPALAPVMRKLLEDSFAGILQGFGLNVLDVQGQQS